MEQNHPAEVSVVVKMCHRAPRMASTVREDQSSIPRTQVKISGMVVHTCTLSASGVNTGGSLCLVL